MRQFVSLALSVIVLGGVYLAPHRAVGECGDYVILTGSPLELAFREHGLIPAHGAPGLSEDQITELRYRLINSMNGHGSHINRVEQGSSLFAEHGQEMKMPWLLAGSRGPQPAPCEGPNCGSSDFPIEFPSGMGITPPPRTVQVALLGRSIITLPPASYQLCEDEPVARIRRSYRIDRPPEGNL